MNILILGSDGLLGFAIFKRLISDGFSVIGTIRKEKSIFKNNFPDSYIQVKNLTDIFELEQLLDKINPDHLINCISCEKISESKSEELEKIFSTLPKMLGEYCTKKNIRLIQVSSDAVFSGKKGNYTEEDVPDPLDDYGKTKLKGEVIKDGHITLRTSIIGHDRFKKRGLLEWFLDQNNCSLFDRSIFSGITTYEFSNIISKIILKNKDLKGLYHISSDPISKFELLSLVKEIYNKETKIKKDSSVEINRSLSSKKFKESTGYSPPNWKEMIISMKKDFMENLK